MSKISEHNKIDNARNYLVNKAIELNCTKLASQLNSLCIDLMVELRLAEKEAAKHEQE